MSILDSTAPDDSGRFRATPEHDPHPLDTDVHHHQHQSVLIEKTLGIDECRPATGHGDHWHVVDTGDKPLGDLFAAQIAEGAPEPVDDYSEDYPDDSPLAVEPSDDHAIAEGFVDTF